jgi:hypothetical protein
MLNRKSRTIIAASIFVFIMAMIGHFLMQLSWIGMTAVFGILALWYLIASATVEWIFAGKEK